MANYDNWYPRIDQNLCTGCGDCIAQCPTGALGWQDNKATLIDPKVCTYCATCESICPEGAIELPYLVVRSEKKAGHYE